MTWTFSAEEWLVDFTSAPRGAVRAAHFLDPVDEQTCGLLTWVNVAPQLVMPSIVPKQRPAAPSAAPSAPVASPTAPVVDHGLPPPPPPDTSRVEDEDDGLEIELTPAPPSLGVFIPTLTRGASATAPGAGQPELEIGLPVEPVAEPPRPIAADLFDEDEDEVDASDEEQQLAPPPPQESAAVSGVIGAVLDDDDDDVLEVEEVLEDAEELLEDAEEVFADEEVLEEAEEVLEEAEEVLEEAEEVLEEAEEEIAKPPPAPPIPPPSPRTPPPVSRPPPPKPSAEAPPKPRSKRKKKKHWYDEVFADHYAYIMPRDSDVSAELDVAFMIESAQLSSQNRILDVGCGDGSHLFGFAKAGYADLTGLDMSLSQLVAGSRRNLSEGAGLTFLYGDMRDLPDGESYDVITCLGGTLGYFEDEQNRACLQQMVERLAPGGKLIIQVMNRDHMMGIVPCRSWWQGRSCLVLDVAEMNFFTNRLKVHRTIVFEDGRQFEHHIQVRAYSVNELGKMISGLGMRVMEVSGSRATRGRFFGSASSDIWICAQRKD